MGAKQIIEVLSTEAKQAIEGAPSSRIGTRVPAETTSQTLAELRDAGVIAAHGGLTIKGSAVAERLQAALLDRSF